jgi:hypothetical protein
MKESTMTEEHKGGLQTFGTTAVNLDLLLAATVGEHEALLVFAGSETVPIPLDDGKLLLAALKGDAPEGES